MAKRDNCVYCGQPIIKRSREHIIQNALGGLYESEDICCDECNNCVISNRLSTINTIISFCHCNSFVNIKSKYLCYKLSKHHYCLIYKSYTITLIVNVSFESDSLEKIPCHWLCSSRMIFLHLSDAFKA